MMIVYNFVYPSYFLIVCFLPLCFIRLHLFFQSYLYSKQQVEAQRDLAIRRVKARNAGRDPDVEAPLDPLLIPGPNRDTSVERNLEIFENMKRGVYEEGEWTLRLKMNLESANPNMYDLVAYRVKYAPHPHAGSKWCIYPMYDFTHGICDSLEHIDYSICTLEFETRREPYYWILWALDMYRPKVYEMSRLNLQYTVLSKRRLLKLVNTRKVRGWNDPRMPTISGLRRRGYTAEIINSFCNDVGATRAINVVEMEKLSQTARQILAPKTRRAMVAMDPIPVDIINFDDAIQMEFENDEKEEEEGLAVMEYRVQNLPTDESLGYHTVRLTKMIYIDSSDFRLEDHADYYGLSPNQSVGLKYYGGALICEEVIYHDKDRTKIKLLRCTVDKKKGRKKPKSFITWIPDDGLRCEVS
jgi:glutaminyl-tRNA synthetase